MFEQAFNQLLNNIHNNQLNQLNLLAPAPQREIIDVAPLQSWNKDNDDVWALVVLHDDSIVSGSADNTLRRWDPKSGQCVSTWTGHTSSVDALAVLHDGSIVSGGVQCEKFSDSDDDDEAFEAYALRRWDPKSGQCLSTWVGHTDYVNALVVLHDGSVLSASKDKTIRHWDAQSGQCLSTWTGHTDYVRALAVLDDGSTVSASDDRTLRHWDTQSGQCLSTWTGHTDCVRALAVLHDGSLVSASDDKTLRHWDPQSGECLSTWTGHTHYVYALAVLHDGSLVSASWDGTLRHWDPQSGQCLSTWKGHTHWVTALAALHDGSIVSASKDKTIRRWPVPPTLVSLEQVEGVLGALKGNRSLQSLALAEVTFTPSITQALAQIIVNHPQLSSIALENCDLTDESVQPILHSLKNPASRVTQFIVSNNAALSQQAQTALQQAIVARPASLDRIVEHQEPIATQRAPANVELVAPTLPLAPSSSPVATSSGGEYAEQSGTFFSKSGSGTPSSPTSGYQGAGAHSGYQSGYGRQPR